MRLYQVNLNKNCENVSLQEVISFIQSIENIKQNGDEKLFPGDVEIEPETMFGIYYPLLHL